MIRHLYNHRCSYTYGYGRAEDLAGVAIVGVIFFSACVAGYESVAKLINGSEVSRLGWVAAAAVVGFVGNESIARFRIRVARRIGSAYDTFDLGLVRLDHAHPGVLYPGERPDLRLALPEGARGLLLSEALLVTDLGIRIEPVTTPVAGVIAVIIARLRDWVALPEVAGVRLFGG